MKRFDPSVLAHRAAQIYNAYHGASERGFVQCSTVGAILSVGADKAGWRFEASGTTWEDQHDQIFSKLSDKVASVEAAFTQTEDAVRGARKSLGLPSRSALLRSKVKRVDLLDPTKYVAVHLSETCHQAISWPREYRPAVGRSPWQILPVDHSLAKSAMSKHTARIQGVSPEGVVRLVPCQVYVVIREGMRDTWMEKLRSLGLEFYNAGMVRCAPVSYKIYPEATGYQDVNILIEQLRALDLFQEVGDTSILFQPGGRPQEFP